MKCEMDFARRENRFLYREVERLRGHAVSFCLIHLSLFHSLTPFACFIVILNSHLEEPESQNRMLQIKQTNK